MDAEHRERLKKQVIQMMNDREQLQAALNENLKVFSGQLFAALENALAELQEQQVIGMGKSRRIAHPAGNGREALQVFIEDWSIILVPLMGLARPNAKDEAVISNALFKEPCARIAVFLTDDPQGRAFYDFIIFEDGAWFAWGYGWPKQQADIENTDFDGLAIELLHSFVKDIFTTWNIRAETALASALDPKRQAYIFGLPGEARQGG